MGIFCCFKRHFTVFVENLPQFAHEGGSNLQTPEREPMSEEFYRMKRLPPYVIAEVNAMRAAARAAGEDIIDLGMGNPICRHRSM